MAREAITGSMLRVVYDRPSEMIVRGMVGHRRVDHLGQRDIVETSGSKPAMDSHAEVRATHRRNGFRWSAHLDLSCILAPKDI